MVQSNSGVTLTYVSHTSALSHKGRGNSGERFVSLLKRTGRPALRIYGAGWI